MSGLKLKLFKLIERNMVYLGSISISYINLLI